MTNHIAHPALIDADAIDNAISKARESFRLSKEEAGKAAAHTYIVWRYALAPNASREARDWVENEITNINKDIAEKTKKAGAKSGYVQIKAKAGASEFTRAVKYVLQFDRADQSSSVSRYCTALTWLHARFADKVIYDAGDLIAAIQNEGGFEAILKKGGNENAGEAKKNTASEAVQKTVEQFLLDRSKAQLASAQAVTSLTIPAGDDESWVLLVGRKSDNGLDILNHFPAKIDSVCTLLGDRLLNVFSPADPTAEFASRLLALGSLVEAGQPSSFTRNKNPNGETLKSEHILTMRNNANSATELVFSTVHAKASTVITAVPASLALQASCTEPVYLPADAIRNMGVQLEGNARRVVKITADTIAAQEGEDNAAGGELGWVMTNEALTAAESENAEHVLRWQPVSGLEYMPLDVELRRFETKAVLDIAQVSEATAELLAEYAKAKADAEPLSIMFCDGAVSLAAGNKKAVTIAKAKGKLRINLRGKDIYNLLEVLREQDVNKATLEVETGGLVRVSWTEPCGHFAIHIPTADAHNKLDDRRFVPMVVEQNSSFADAA